MKRPIKRPPAKGVRRGRIPPTPIGPGTMTEYGWYDAEIESGVETIMRLRNATREDALIEYFRNV